eukprot:5075952-Lingulodinium_polyedra.AAC.1
MVSLHLTCTRESHCEIACRMRPWLTVAVATWCQHGILHLAAMLCMSVTSEEAPTGRATKQAVQGELEQLASGLKPRI